MLTLRTGSGTQTMQKRMIRSIMLLVSITLAINTVVAIAIFVFICRDDLETELESALLMGAAGVVMIAVSAVISGAIATNVMTPVHDLVKRYSDETEPQDNNDKDKEQYYAELEPVAETADKLLRETHNVAKRLEKEKEKFSLITENMTEGMLLLDSDLTVLSVNRTALQIFAPDRDPSSKLTLDEFTDDKQLKALVDKVETNNSSRGVIRRGDRSWRTFVSKSEYAGAFGIVVILVDVTESLKTEEIRRTFSANVSHELKTPLTTIRGFGEMMENGIISDSGDVKRYGGTIYREATRLLLLITDIMRLSEIEDGSIGTAAEPVDLYETAQSCEEILQEKALKNDVTVSVTGGPAIVYGSQSYFNELILNLMDNSIKYNKPGGSVSTEVSPLEDGVRITVSDTGIGIGEEDIDRVFERFYRVDKSRSKETGGTGLGLSIVKHITSMYNGRLNISSRLGSGTEITVFLPNTAADGTKK